MQTLDVISKKDDVDLENFLDDFEDDGCYTPPPAVTSKTFETPEKVRTNNIIKKRESSK